MICPSDNYSLSITRLRDNQLIKSLEGHEGQISFVKHFYNKNKKKDYLISACKKSVVKVWDLTDDYNLLFSLNVDYSENTKIFSCIALFTENKENYLITSSNENKKK